MKAILGTLAVSVALPISVCGQASGAAGASAAGVSVGAGAGVGSVGVARSAGVAGTGAISPSGSLAGQTPTGSGLGTVTTPSGTPVATPGSAAPVGPINPGGISGLPPAAAGRTFDRSIIGGGPTDTIVDPAGAQPTFRFPPSSTLPTPVVTNTVTGAAGGFPPSTFPPGPVGINNMVGTNFGRVLTTAPREPVAINLPPGTRVVTNTFGVSEVVAPPPVLVPTNVGRSPLLDRGAGRGVVIPRTVPPREVPRVSRGPILDRRTVDDR